MNKKIISIFLLYFFQFMAASCDPCSCERAKTFERIYNGIELKAWDTSGFQSKEVFEGVNKNSFGLSISVLFKLNQIANFKPKIDLGAFGFASAYAFTCDCESDQYINADPIVFINILVTNIQTQEISDVTKNFTTYGYNGEQITISELFENRADWHDGFQIDMIEYSNVPDSSIFTVKIILESGAELIEQSQEINFN